MFKHFDLFRDIPEILNISGAGEKLHYISMIWCRGMKGILTENSSPDLKRMCADMHDLRHHTLPPNTCFQTMYHLHPSSSQKFRM